MTGKSSLLLQALRCQNRSRPPVWIMRQAGRYLPEYRALRAKHTFLEMVHQPDLAAAITLMPVKKFGMDAAILFSDILVVAEALGVGLQFKDSVGPVIERPLKSAQDVVMLPKINPEDKFDYVSDAIKLLLPELEVPLIGFCGGPFTIASYMIEGKSSRDLPKTKKWMMQDPKGFHKLLSHLTTCNIDYLKLQTKAGVHAVQIFESWANALSHPHFHEFCLKYLHIMVKELQKEKIPVIVFCRGSSIFAEDIASIQPNAISVDWNADLSVVRSRVPKTIALQGNLDPDVLYAPCTTVKREVQNILKRMDGDPGYVFNLGHGIKPDINPDAVKTLVETVKSFSTSL